jgi:hypothetical protein
LDDLEGVSTPLFYLALAWEHHFSSFYLHRRTVLEIKHDHLGHLDLLAVEDGVMAKAQWANHGDEIQVDEKSIANHHWKVVLVA